MTTNKEVIYIDLESLLDLRQGFLTTKFSTYGELHDYLKTYEYSERDSDVFPNTEVGEYKKSIEAGDLKLIQGALITYIGYPLSVAINSIFNKGNIEGAVTVPVIYCNIYPFVFNDEEIDIIKDGIFNMLPNGCQIEIVNSPLGTINHLYIKDNNIKNLFIYDWRQWLDLHSEMLSKVPMNDVKLYGPRLYEKEPNEDQYDDMIKNGFENPFIIFEACYSAFIKLNLLPVAFYTNYLISKNVIDEYNDNLVKSVPELTKETKETIQKIEDQIYGNHNK